MSHFHFLFLFLFSFFFHFSVLLFFKKFGNFSNFFLCNCFWSNFTLNNENFLTFLFKKNSDHQIKQFHWPFKKNKFCLPTHTKPIQHSLYFLFLFLFYFLFFKIIYPHYLGTFDTNYSIIFKNVEIFGVNSSNNRRKKI